MRQDRIWLALNANTSHLKKLFQVHLPGTGTDFSAIIFFFLFKVMIRLLNWMNKQSMNVFCSPDICGRNLPIKCTSTVFHPHNVSRTKPYLYFVNREQVSRIKARDIHSNSALSQLVQRVDLHQPSLNSCLTLKSK